MKIPNSENPIWKVGNLVGIVMDLEEHLLAFSLNHSWLGYHFRLAKGVDYHFICCIAHCASVRLVRCISGEDSITSYFRNNGKIEFDLQHLKESFLATDNN